MEIRTQSKSGPPVHFMADRNSAANWRAMRWTAFSSSIASGKIALKKSRGVKRTDSESDPSGPSSTDYATRGLNGFHDEMAQRTHGPSLEDSL
jgi:hypothetical protein